jgi:hypothetical protein
MSRRHEESSKNCQNKKKGVNICENLFFVDCLHRKLVFCMLFLCDILFTLIQQLYSIMPFYVKNVAGTFQPNRNCPKHWRGFSTVFDRFASAWYLIVLPAVFDRFAGGVRPECGLFSSGTSYNCWHSAYFICSYSSCSHLLLFLDLPIKLSVSIIGKSMKCPTFTK